MTLRPDRLFDGGAQVLPCASRTRFSAKGTYREKCERF